MTQERIDLVYGVTKRGLGWWRGDGWQPWVDIDGRRLHNFHGQVGTKEEALAAARQYAEEEAAMFVGGWDIAIWRGEDKAG